MLKRKLFRDLLQNRTQFVSIFLMAFLGLFIFAGVDAESNGIGVSVADYYEKTNLADYWVVGDSFSETEKEALEAQPEIHSVNRKLVVNAKAKLTKELDMELNFLEENDSSYPYLIEGEAFDTQKEGIWLEKAFAKAQKIKLGDVIKLQYEGMEFAEEVKGIVIHPEYIFYSLDENSMLPQYGSYGYAFLSYQEFPMQQELRYNRLVIDIPEKIEAVSLKELIRNTLDREAVVVLDRSQNAGCESVASEQEQHEMMGIMFSAVFLLIAVMGIVTTMTRMTSNQRIQIGTLKALGFTKRKITMHYVSYGIVISMLGSILGAFAGYLVIPSLFLPNMQAFYILPQWKTQISDKSCYAMLLAVLVAAFVSFLACRKELRDMPAITLKPAVPKNMKHSLLEKSRFWLSLRFSTQWNIRDILRNRARSLMGIAGVAGCTMLLVCAFGCKDSCMAIGEWMYGELLTAKQKIIFEQGLSETAKKEYGQQFEGQLIQEGSCEFRTENREKTGNITVLNQGNYLHYQNQKGEEITLPAYGVALSAKLADLLGIKEGEFLEWHVVGEEDWERSRVSMIYRTPSGQGITLSKNEYEKLGYTFHATALYTNKTVPEYRKEREEIAGVSSLTQMKADLNENMKAMFIMTAVLIIGAVVLGIIVLYNMGVLSFTEKTREIATLKVLGFSSGKIRGILMQQNIWITVIGIIIGLGLGYALLDILMHTMSEDNDMPTVIHMLSYLYAVLGTWLVSTGVNRLLSRKVRTICMVDALKGVE